MQQEAPAKPASAAARNGQRLRRLHPLPVRIAHWINALGIVIMIGSGWKIYNDEVIFGWLHFPDAFTLGGDPETASRLHGNGGYSGALLWHFAGMWLVMGSGFFYVIYALVSGRIRQRLFPIRLSDVVRQLGEALHFRLKHDDITIYNHVQRLLYLVVIMVAGMQVLAGLALWKPMQWPWLVSLFGGFQGTRLAHFLGMTFIVAFLIVHVSLAVIVPRTLLAMITGGPRVGERKAAAPPPPGTRHR
jgi:thiosulfate reductase cytochrome b subunit